jgi:hypothetical protein
LGSPSLGKPKFARFNTKSNGLPLLSNSSYVDRKPQGSPNSNGIQPISQYLTNNGIKPQDLGISIHNSENKKRPNTMQNGKRSKKRRQIA